MYQEMDKSSVKQIIFAASDYYRASKELYDNQPYNNWTSVVANFSSNNTPMGLSRYEVVVISYCKNLQRIARLSHSELSKLMGEELSNILSKEDSRLWRFVELCEKICELNYWGERNSLIYTFHHNDLKRLASSSKHRMDFQQLWETASQVIGKYKN